MNKKDIDDFNITQEFCDMIYDKSFRFYKVINSAKGRPDHLFYKEGINISPMYDTMKKDGIYMTMIQTVGCYFGYGPIIAEIALPEGSNVHIEFDSYLKIPEFYANKVIINKMMYLGDVNTIQYLIDRGMDISIDNYTIFKWALNRYPSVWNYLVEKYPDIIKEQKEWIFL